MSADLWKKRKQLWQPPDFWRFKVCAVLCAILLWFYVMETQNPMTEESFTVPVEMRNLSSSLAIPDTNRQVTIRVQGSSAVMNELTSRQLSAYCDFSDVEEGEATLPVQVGELPEGVTLVSVLPESISFTLEAVVSESFPVEVRVQGEPAENYSLLEPLDAVLSPAMVTLSGSQEYISQVETVFVSVDVTGLEENYSKNLSVEVLDFNGNNITEWFTCNPSTVDVLVPVVYSQPEKSVAVSPVYVGTPALGYRITRVVVEPSTVRAFGDLDVLDNLYYVETSVIDVNGLDRTTSFTVTLLHGNNVTLSTTNATVVVQVEPESTTTVTKDLVYYENLAEGLVCTLPTVELEMLLSGADTYIDNLDTSAVVPFVDLGQISGPGSYTLSVQVNLPANISLLSITPATVEVTVEEAGLDGDASDLEDAESGDPLPEEGME